MMEGSARAVTVLAFLLGMPFIGYIAAAGVQWKENSALRQELLKELPDNVAAIESLTISGLCEHPGVRSDQTLNEVCSQNDNLGWMKRGAVFSATSGILLVGIIKLAGTLASKRRMLLLLLFSPGLHFTILAVSVLAVLDSVLGIAALYYGESALIGRVHIGIMLGFGIGAFVVVVSLIRAQLFAIRKASTVAIGKKLERTEYLSLCNFVEALADRMGAERPESMVAGLEPNFYVTEAEVTCLDGELRGRTLYISLPLCRILNLDEFAAIVAHELGHYKGLDTKFSRRFFPIYRGACAAVANLASSFSEKGSASDFILLPALLVVSFFLDSFSVAENEISRDRELAADNEAAKAVSAKSMATALLKVYAFSDIWPTVRDHMKEMIQRGQAVTNASAFFANAVSQIPASEAFAGISEEGPTHPTDTHPPLSSRLRNLNFGAAELAIDAGMTSRQSSAIGLVDDADDLEVELSAVTCALMVRSGEVQFGTETASVAI